MLDEYDDGLLFKDNEPSNALGERSDRNVFRGDDETRMAQIGVNHVWYEEDEVYANHQ